MSAPAAGTGRVGYAMALLLALALGACGPREPAPERPEDKALQRAVEAPLDRARAVEAETREAKERRDRELEQQGG